MSTSDRDSGSDSEPEFESIIATRARRSNAGSRLRQLLDLEESNSVMPSNDDDENVNLLFQEDEDDGEFEESGDEEENSAGEEEDDEEDTKKPKNTSKPRSETPDNKQEEGDDEDDETPAVDSDEMLSNSDISASDDDESEGERELQKQERLKRRRKRKADMPDVLKKKKAKTTPSKPAAPKPQQSNKSHRSNIFDNEPIAPDRRRHSSRTATVESSIATHVRMEKEYERRQTQAPVEKKEYVQMTLEERLEEAKTTEKENILSLTRFYEQEVQKKKKQRDAANSRKYKLTDFVRFSSKGIYITPNDEVRMIEEEIQRWKDEEEQRNKRKLMYQKRKQARLSKGNATETEQKDESSEAKVVKSKDDVETEQNDVKEKTPIKKEDTPEVKKEETEETPSKVVRFEGVIEVDDKAEKKDEDKAEVTKDTETQNDEECEEVKEEEKIIYEGPPQHVTRNYVMFEEFSKPINAEDVKKVLFGRQSVLTGTRQDPIYKTICIIKQNESSNIDLQKIQAARNESFKSLIQLPKFGEKVTVIDDGNSKLSMEENEVVQIVTPAPVGINLPNGQKKICLTSGLPAMYYDPTNGVPYATVDAFKILKSITEGEYQWLQLDNGGINSRYAGGIGCYIGKKDQRHAAGVPEGFN